MVSSATRLDHLGLGEEVGELLLDTLNPLPNLDTEQGTMKHGA